MQEENIKTLTFGCRLNALESEKIKNMLKSHIDCAIVVNTCAVTAEAERQSAQAVRKIARENPNVVIFVTGCAATRNPELFKSINNVIVIPNNKKTNLDAYITAYSPISTPKIEKFVDTSEHLSKKFIQVQNGCNHKCAYCVTRLLRGPAISFDYTEILENAKNAVQNGFYEIVLTGVDIASYAKKDGDKFIFISDICKKLLNDIPEIKRLRLSSMDPASPELYKIIDLIHTDSRMMPHLHLSMQSGSNTILSSMGRRHSVDSVRKLVQYATDNITFSWDIICGFPGETNELFNETLDLVQETKPIKIHAFPFSPRPDTVAVTMPNQTDRAISKKRVKIITDAVDENLKNYMATQIGKTTSVLAENNNTGRTPDDIPVKIMGKQIDPKTICNVKLTDISDSIFVAQI